MPLYEFKCDTCGCKVERLYASYRVMQAEPVKTCDCASCDGQLERQASAPAFAVHGFNAQNGYTGEQCFTRRLPNGVRTEVKGNFNAFADGLHA